LGGFLALTALLPDYGFIPRMLMRITEAALISFIAFGFNNKRTYLKTTSTLIVLSFLLSGAVIFFYLALKPTGLIIINDRVYFDISPVLLIIITVAVYFILFLYKKLFKNKTNSSIIHSVNFRYKNYIGEFKCKTDTGCSLKEPFSGSSVIIAEKELLGNIILDSEKTRIIPFNSLGGKGIITGFKPDEVYIDGKKLDEEVYIGISEGIITSEIKSIIPLNILQ
jgi:stage II sporulation protein GA (sporulation sigma-E factor processing peptidase)